MDKYRHTDTDAHRHRYTQIDTHTETHRHTCGTVTCYFQRLRSLRHLRWSGPHRLLRWIQHSPSHRRQGCAQPLLLLLGFIDYRGYVLPRRGFIFDATRIMTTTVSANSAPTMDAQTHGQGHTQLHINIRTHTQTRRHIQAQIDTR
jgi:hypothetical protein